MWGGNFRLWGMAIPFGRVPEMETAAVARNNLFQNRSSQAKRTPISTGFLSALNMHTRIKKTHTSGLFVTPVSAAVLVHPLATPTRRIPSLSEMALLTVTKLPKE